MQSVFARSPVAPVGATSRSGAGKRRGVGASRIAVSLHAVTSDLRASSMTAAASRFRLATATKTIAKVSLRYVDMHLIKPP